jgi:hypothetical protein
MMVCTGLGCIGCCFVDRQEFDIYFYALSCSYTRYKLINDGGFQDYLYFGRVRAISQNWKIHVWRRYHQLVNLELNSSVTKIIIPSVECTMD